MMVRPRASITRAPFGTGTLAPTPAMRSPSITMVAFSTGAAPVPSISRAPCKTMACASRNVVMAPPGRRASYCYEGETDPDGGLKLRLLSAGPDTDRFAIKGGCNLRFFFESVRYSEGIDLDVSRIPLHVLKEKVGRILEGPALALPLKSWGVTLRDVSAPKQTETTQHWKLGLAAEGRSLPLHTKIEFSR